MQNCENFGERRGYRVSGAGKDKLMKRVMYFLEHNLVFQFIATGSAFLTPWMFGFVLKCMCGGKV